MEKHLKLSGTPGVGFTVEASQDNGIGLDDPKEFEINERNTVNVFIARHPSRQFATVEFSH